MHKVMLVLMAATTVWVSPAVALTCGGLDLQERCGQVETYFATDEGLGFKALVIDDQATPSVGVGTQGTLDAAIADARSRCERGSSSSGETCRLRAVGDHHVTGLSQAETATAKRKYARTQTVATAIALRATRQLRDRAPLRVSMRTAGKPRPVHVRLDNPGHAVVTGEIVRADGYRCALLLRRTTVQRSAGAGTAHRRGVAHLNCADGQVGFGTFVYRGRAGYAELVGGTGRTNGLSFGALGTGEPTDSFNRTWQAIRDTGVPQARSAALLEASAEELKRLLEALDLGVQGEPAVAAFGEAYGITLDVDNPPRAIAQIYALIAPATPSRQLADCDATPADVYASASNSVVSVLVATVDPFRATKRLTMGIGSGVAFDLDGHVLTNAHVVYGATQLNVRTANGLTVPGTLVGADPLTDIAVVKIQLPRKQFLEPLPFRADEVLMGEAVVAIGSPFGLESTLTQGIISGLGRDISASVVGWQVPLIQTDAPINPGNSGGPLIDRCGAVVGINTLVVPAGQNVGFAVPAPTAKRIAQSLIEHGRVIRPWHGVYGRLTSWWLRTILRPVTHVGLLVETVEPGSPAQQIGLKGGTIRVEVGRREYLIGGDIITHVNGVALRDVDDLSRALGTLEVGQTVQLEYVRDGRTTNAEIKLPERPQFDADAVWLRAGRDKE